MFCGVYRHLLEESLGDEQFLIGVLLLVELWDCESSALEDLWLLFYFDVPLLPLLLLEEGLGHLDDRVHFLLRVLLDAVQKLSHASWVASDGVWHTVDPAELGWHGDLST